MAYPAQINNITVHFNPTHNDMVAMYVCSYYLYKWHQDLTFMTYKSNIATQATTSFFPSFSSMVENFYASSERSSRIYLTPQTMLSYLR